MNAHSTQERERAKKALPKSLYDFLVSPTLVTIYAGIQKKHNFDLGQLLVFTDVVNVTLMGLETESALETNLHQAMHELSNQGARELVADIQDRVFKEAKRRVAENILEPSVWSETQPKPEDPEEKHRELIDTLPDNDPELLSLYERDKKRREEMEALQKKELEEALEQAKKQEAVDAAMANPTVASPGGAEETAGAPTTPAVSIVAEKLSAPSAAQTQTVEVKPQESKIQEIKTVTPPSPVKRSYPEAADPYRERPE